MALTGHSLRLTIEQNPKMRASWTLVSRSAFHAVVTSVVGD